MKVAWTELALYQFDDALDYWDEHNKSTAYSKKLRAKVKSQIQFLKEFPYSGRQSVYVSARYVVIDRYSIFYRIDDDVIHILAFWHNSQEPDKLLDAIN
jgi:plasmid stabilization system protein ParE